MHLTAETRLNAILDGTGAGTWEYNLDTGEIIFNERWATMLGYTLEELSPLSFQTWEKLSPHRYRVSKPGIDRVP